MAKHFSVWSPCFVLFKHVLTCWVRFELCQTFDKTFILFSCLVSDVLRVSTDAMFDARMRADSIKLFVSMDTVSRYALISLMVANEEDALVDLSENVIEDNPTPKRKGNKARTRRWSDEETDILIDMFEESACLWDIF